MSHMMKKRREFQDIRIRGVPTELVRRFRSVLVAQGLTMLEWFMETAAATADGNERRMKVGGGK
jgi:hypothetical protein